MGAHLHKGARELGLESEIVDVRQAFSGPRLIQSLLWHFRGRRPIRLESFSDQVFKKCQTGGWSHLLATGLAPINATYLQKIGDLGIKRINFLTDDPWNRSHKAPWFLSALKSYDQVFTPRASNLEDLREWGCKHVSYLPFAYDSCHLLQAGRFPQEGTTDVLFVGGGDRDRYPYALRLQNSGIRLALFGSAWKAFPDLKKSWEGNGDVDRIREETAKAKITLCLVRRANRDGHVMRSYEAAASGGCMLVEDTQEHRQIFGAENHCVLYFNDMEQMVEKTRRLLSDSSERLRLRQKVYQKITTEKNTYKDRLLMMTTGS